LAAALSVDLPALHGDPVTDVMSSRISLF